MDTQVVHMFILSQRVRKCWDLRTGNIECRTVNVLGDLRVEKRLVRVLDRDVLDRGRMKMVSFGRGWGGEVELGRWYS